MDARASTQAPVDYLLHLADNALILGQRNAEWCGHAPILEEDLAMANQALDLIGQARLLYQCAAERLNAQGHATRPGTWPAGPVTEDVLAYFRDDRAFRNYTLQELPHSPGLVPAGVGDRDWGISIVRNYLYAVLMELVWQRLAEAPDAQLAAIAARSLKEVRYHLRHARDWLVRLGDGTPESHQRAQAAVDYLLPFTEEFWAASDVDALAAKAGVDVPGLRGEWNRRVDAALQEATLARPPAVTGYVPQGKQGIHSEHLSYLLAEMQSLARAHPGATW
ncbi:MAG TPA: phenylacetate-CoA oxygenase subunit PaaC [Ottowia sp.]|uniref:1,2-phenylacetyl-CoA epoxidase subunit PaaC n=1 Tax=Ottowia sp. TaxID=1898956 RepID=UPI002CCA3918|nr:1,2-phenylacetyl-CoA epoxidase subunit PaaC [Ottowia sp.]HMN20062.1 phenylacetate-CoA oxygenase subunit PaaC [Ottowia sp.]